MGTTETYPSIPLKPKDLRKIYGFTVGGPIIKNKLFWTYTYDQHSRIFPGQAVPSSPSTFFTLPNAVPTAGFGVQHGDRPADGRYELPWTSSFALWPRVPGWPIAQATRRLQNTAFTLYQNDINGLNSRSRHGAAFWRPGDQYCRRLTGR